MEQSERPAEISEALVAALAEIQNPEKSSEAKVQTKTGGSYSYRYEQLSEILAMARPIFGRHGLAIQHDITNENGHVKVRVVFTHKSGQVIEGLWLTLPAGNTPQETGGAVTYARRYTLTAMLGIAGEDDDAQALPTSQPARTAVSNGTNGKANQQQLNYLHTLVTDLAFTDAQRNELKAKYQVQSTKDLTKEQASEIIDSLLKQLFEKVTSFMDDLNYSETMRKGVFMAHGLKADKLDGKALKAVLDDLAKQRAPKPVPVPDTEGPERDIAIALGILHLPDDEVAALRKQFEGKPEDLAKRLSARVDTEVAGMDNPAPAADQKRWF